MTRVARALGGSSPLGHQLSELGAFLRMLAASQGVSSLSVAVCGNRRLRDYLIQRARQAWPRVAMVDVPADTVDVFGLAVARAADSERQGLFVVGLEHSLLSADAGAAGLRSLNASRDLWEGKFNCPVVLWLADEAVEALAKSAPDFWRYCSHLFEFFSAETARGSAASDPVAGNIAAAAALSADAQRFRIAELERRLDETGEASDRARLHYAVSWANELMFLCDTVGDPNGVRAAATRLAALQGALHATTDGATEPITATGVEGPEPIKLAQKSVDRQAVGGREITNGAYYGPPVTDRHEALRIYLGAVASAFRHLPLRGVDVGASDPSGGSTKLDLAHVYVDLDTRTYAPRRQRSRAGTKRAAEKVAPDERARRPISALQAAGRCRRLVVLGEPGSGKSTLLNHLGLCLAMEVLEPGAGWLARLPGWPRRKKTPVPIVLVLHDIAGKVAARSSADAGPVLWAAFEQQLADRNLAFASPHLQAVLESGEALLLLDGLDEIPDRPVRRAVRDAVASLARAYPGSRLIVTCRTLSYQDPEGQIEGFPTFELAPLGERQIHRFIDAWYGELARLGVVRPEASAGLAARLHDAVERHDLRRLAANPLLLTVMALVHTHKGRLPEARAQLYEETVDILLWRWDELKATARHEIPRLRDLLRQAERDEVDLKRVLWALAYEAQATGGADDAEGVVDIREARLLAALAALHPSRSPDWALEVVEVMKVRAGLLLERAPAVYGFPHRTFQEYLAGAHLSTCFDRPGVLKRLLRDVALWRQTIILAAGRLVYVAIDLGRAIALVKALCPSRRCGGFADQGAWLAAEALLEIGVDRARADPEGGRLVAKVAVRVVDVVSKSRLTAKERAAAGNALGRLGDPRFRADAWWFLPSDGLLGFIEIPGGPFRMGSDKKRDPEAYDDEGPEHEVILPTYYIGKYPVTVAQFRAFVEDSGFQPQDADFLGGTPNHPVVSVLWVEALAYCRWLTEKLRTSAQTPEPLATRLRRGGDGCGPWQVTLPSEAEWEKAARGTDGRIYPWGNDPDPNCANYSDTGIGGTSTVGCFPAGKSPSGVEELSGNVWEWTRSLWGKDSGYPYKPGVSRENLDSPDVPRVVRGGSFGDPRGGVRAACRLGVDPGGGDSGLGFRVVVSPFSSDL